MKKRWKVCPILLNDVLVKDILAKIFEIVGFILFKKCKKNQPYGQKRYTFSPKCKNPTS